MDKNVKLAITSLIAGIILDFTACFFGGNGMLFTVLMLSSMVLGLGFVIGVNRVNNEVTAKGSSEEIEISTGEAA